MSNRTPLQKQALKVWQQILLADGENCKLIGLDENVIERVIINQVGRELMSCLGHLETMMHDDDKP